ncbi:Uncharacterised protein [Mycobacterium tuberculosis]|uniref:Uncharacterized protein n=1 Tax=Mycobacterium tuberculosis TaxID=1773 RepID=A0A916LCM6_MYCTX|nr:Uncharacterised protein [Mycobacterium tuberculosis]COY71098.1 Uncharacterised protein [Mycobacterium tuberculosis]
MYVYAVLSGCWSALSCSKEGTERSVTGIALYSHSAFWRSLCFLRTLRTPVGSHVGTSPPL